MTKLMDGTQQTLDFKNGAKCRSMQRLVRRCEDFRIEGRASLRRGSGRIEGGKPQASIKDTHRASERPGRKLRVNPEQTTANRITGSNVRLGTEMPVGSVLISPNASDQ